MSGEDILKNCVQLNLSAVELRAHREAAAQFARALRYAADLPAARRAALLEAYSYECYLTDQPTEAIEARQAALAAWRQATATS